MVVAQHWPGSLISVLALDLTLLVGFFPNKLYSYLNCSKSSVAQWCSTQDFCGLIHVSNAVYLLSGRSDFLRRALSTLLGCQHGIVTIEWTRCSASRSTIQRATKAGHKVLAAFGLHPLVVADFASGSATNSQHLIGFGLDLGSLVTLSVESGLPHTLRHVLDGGTEDCFPSVSKSSLPVLVNPARAVLLHDGIAQSEGLLPSWSPDILIYTPLDILSNLWLVQGLTLPERL